MLNLRTSAIIISIFLAASGIVAAEERRVELPFAQGMRMFLENNLQVKASRLDPKIAGAAVTSARGAFDPELFGSFRRSDSSMPLSSRSSVAAGGRSSVESESYNFNAGVSGTTGLGTEYRFEVRDGWTADSFSGFEFEYESFTGVTVRQPLLRGFQDGQLMALNVALKDRTASEQRFRTFLTDALSDYAGAWWALMSSRGALEVRRESLKLAETLLEVNRKKLEAGVLSRLELVQAASAAASRREDLLVAEKALREAERRMKELITQDAYEMKDDEIVPVGGAPLRPASGQPGEAISDALSSRPDYMERKTALERERIIVKYASNQAWPEVDLEASYGFNGLGGSFTDSFSNMDSNPQWSVGVVFSYPLGNRAAKGELETARLKATQAVLGLKRLEQEIVIRVSAAMKQLETDARRLEAADEAVRLAEETLDAEEKKLEAGRSTTFNVLSIQEDLLIARLKRLDAVRDYNTSLVSFYREKGTLLDELGVRITELEEAE